jgi:hypothetical protein
MENLGEAILKLSTQDAGLTQGIDKAKRNAELLDRAFATTTRKMGDSLTGFLLGPLARLTSGFQDFVRGPLNQLAAGLTALAALNFARGVINVGDELQKMSVKTGIAVEELSALRLGAELADSSLQEAGRSIQFMQRAMVEARQSTGDQREAFDALGISVKQLSTLSREPLKAFELIAQRLLEVENVTNRNVLAQRIFGRSAQDLLPLLKTLAEEGMAGLRRETERVGAVMTTDMARAAEKFNDNLRTAKLGLQGLTAYITGPVIAGFNDLLEKMGLVQTTQETVLARQADALVKRQAELQKKLQPPFTQMDPRGDLTAAVRQEIAQNNAILASIQAQRQALAAKIETVKTKRTGEVPDREALSAATAAAKAAADAARRDQQERVRDLEQIIAQDEKTRLEALVRIYESVQSPLDQYLERLRELQSLLGRGLDLDTYARAVENLNNWLFEQSDAFKASSIEAERHGKILEDLRGPTEQFVQLQSDLQTLVDRGRISLEEYNSALRAGAERLPGVITEADRTAKETINVARELGLTFTSAFEDAVVGGESLSAVLEGILDDLVRLTLRLLIMEPLLKSLSEAMKPAEGGNFWTSSLGQGLKSFGGWIAGLLGGGGIDIGAAGRAGFQHGGSFIVPGSGGPDSQRIRFNATPGERVIVEPPSARGGGVTVEVINQTGQPSRTEEQRTAGGGRNIRVVIGEMVSDVLARPGGPAQRTMRSVYGSNPGLTSR